MSSGEVLAFTDSDCIPSSNWIECGVQALLESPEAAVVGGCITIFARDPDQLTAAELYESVQAFRQKSIIEQKNYSVTANLFTYRRVFDEVGGFDARLKSSGDLEWGRRVHRHGLRQIYAHQAIVRHPARRSLSALLSKYLRIEGGKFQLRQLLNRSHSLAAIQMLIKSIKRTLRSRKHVNLSSWPDWARYLTVEAMIVSVRLCELVRLALGGGPRRC